MGKPFEKGDARINRRGRPKKGQALTDIFNYKLDQRDECGKLQREAVAEKLIGLALGGDMTAIRYVMDRVDGRPKETVILDNTAIETKLWGGLTMADFECKSRDMALVALDTIATSMNGTQRLAVLAVKEWVQENTTPRYIQEELLSILNAETEGQRKAREWWNRGSQKADGEWVTPEPEDGAEWICVWKAETKRWEPPFPPPLIVRKGED
jgi:hypothetical protein